MKRLTIIVLGVFATLQFSGCEVSRQNADGSKWTVGFRPTDEQLELLGGYTK